MYHSVLRMLVSTLFTFIVAGLALLAPMTGDEAFFLALFAFIWFFMIEVFFAMLQLLTDDDFYGIYECLLTAAQIVCVVMFVAVVQILL